MSIADSYDAIPYESTPLPETHPGHLACLGRLYGIDPAPPTNCRVLELGCASGGNLIPMAAHLPDSYFLGIELSPEQAEEGAARVADLGLTNCEIRQADILDLQDEGVRFDYIITHGVYSWSPPEVRDRIMKLSSQLLSPQGVAYISFNVLPGWRMRGMLRDMLLYQVRDIRSPVARLETAQGYLDQLEVALAGSNEVFAFYLQQEIERIRHSHPSYLYHEYLEAFNEPLLLADFIGEANRHGLDYVCDIVLSMQTPAYPEQQSGQLPGVIDDPVGQLQQTDFLSNRSFHQSLLCHQGLKPSHLPDLTQLGNFAWLADLHPPENLELHQISPVSFTHQEGQQYEIGHPLTKAGIALLAQHFPASLSFSSLISAAAERVRSEGGDLYAEQGDEMLNELFTLYAKGVIHARPVELSATNTDLAEWHMDPAARLGILRGDSHIPTIHHGAINLDPFATQAIRYLDGCTDKEKLLQKLLDDFKPGGCLAGLVDPNMPGDQLAYHLDHHLEQLLALFRKHGVLG